MSLRVAGLTLAIWGTAPAAMSCTLCGSDTAAAVRSTVLGGSFLANLAALAAPIPWLLAVIFAARALERRGGRGP
jgi:hypothetical protein